MDVYYRIYFADRIGKLTVVCLQEFDECDYKDHKFLRDEHGEKMKWSEETDALKHLNDTFKIEIIDPDCITANNPNFRLDDTGERSDISDDLKD